MAYNKAIIEGRLTADPDVRYTQGEKPIAIARFTLAVDKKNAKAIKARNDANPGNKPEQTADFIQCVAFDREAEFAQKYLKKGYAIMVTGSIQTGSYVNREGQRVYTTEVRVAEYDFPSSGSGNGNGGSQAAPAQQAAPAPQPQAPQQTQQPQPAPQPQYQQPAPQPAPQPQYQQPAPQPAPQPQYQQPAPQPAPQPQPQAPVTQPQQMQAEFSVPMPSQGDEDLPWS